MIACLSTINQPDLNDVNVNDLFECYLESTIIDNNNTVS